MNLPEFIKTHLEKAKRILDSQAVQDIVFSSGAYQIEVYDSERKIAEYPFIQLDEQNNIQDAFCSCSEQNFCIHLAIGYLAIFRDQEISLEMRYQNSFWYHLLFAVAERIGFHFQSLKKQEKDSYRYISKTGKKLFEITLSSQQAKQKFQEIEKSLTFEKDIVPLKFSKITEQELLEWKQKKAPATTQFELSFWADLAKWFTFLQDQKRTYQITFDTEGIPNRVKICWSDLLTMDIYLSVANLSKMIASLKTVTSNLQVFDELSETIASIRYDEKRQAFQILKQKDIQKKPKTEGEVLGEWIYVKSKGFYPATENPLLEKEWIEKDQISQALSDFTSIFERYLKELTIYKLGHIAKHHLYFDKQDLLHILVFPNDLKEAFDEDSAFFAPWYYVPSKGFYRMKDHLFDQKEKIISKEDISLFIHSHRIWLHNFEGFQTHFKTMPSRFEYHLTKNKELQFHLKLSLEQDIENYIDLEDWLYIPNHGFYLKKDSKKGIPIRSGLILKEQEIGAFIETHVEELEEIPGFFAKRSPIEKDFLKVQVIDKNIEVTPEVIYRKGYSDSNVDFFDSYVYVQDEGFSKLENYEKRRRYKQKTIVEEGQVPYFLTHEISNLGPIELDKKLRKPKKLKLKVHKLKKEKKRTKIFWLAQLSYRSEIGEVNTLDLRQEMDEHKKYIFSKAGLIHLEDPKFEWIAQLKKNKISKKANGFRFTTLEWLRLCLLEEIVPPRGKSKEAEEIRSLLKDLSTLESDRLLDLTYLKSKLRPYQETGVQWLWFLYVHNLSGLLCDDMGLGKTHQAMALLASILKEDVDREHKYLVICPTSVIYHWEELIKTYLPEMRVLTYYGMERSLQTFEMEYDLLLTSYGILRLGKESLKEYRFEVAIFDEMQIAKNPSSQTHQSIKQLRSNMKIGLSGTPIENSLKELKALFEITLPGYLPSDKEFRELFIAPIEKNQDPEKKKLLSKLIHPFILRRKKQDVLKDLPEKIEEIAYCKLSDEQQTLYDQTLQEKQNELLSVLEKEQEPIPYLHIFALLSKLKQICNHPSLIYKDSKSYKNHASGKWELFVELLQEARQSQQKLVVFSQYTTMLEIIEQYLKQKKIVYASIKGSTRKRQNEIRKFREDPNCEVFVASLLAAGVGIDLTAGSVVIHYDRWWNPAKENQATDRVHRIGQNRGVQVFKLVTKHTIEEEIHTLIEKKAALAEELIGKDDQDQIKTLSRKELIAILKKSSLQI